MGRSWEEYGKVCDYVPVSEVAEAAYLFSEFTTRSTVGAS